MAAKKHSKFSPSKMERILFCPGSFALEAAAPARDTKYTDEGDAAHQLAQWALTDGRFDTQAYLGKAIPSQDETRNIVVTEEMCKNVQIYVDAVRKRIADYQNDSTVKNVTLLVETKIDTSPALGVPKQGGTVDTLLVIEYKDGTALLSVEDLKYGQGVKVVAENNTQLMTYAAGALAAYEKKFDVRHVQLVIHMARLGYVSEHIVTKDELNAFSKTLKQGVIIALEQEKLFREKGVDALTLRPDKKQCMFCKAKKSLCPAFNATRAKKSSPETEKKPAVKKNPSPPPSL